MRGTGTTTQGLQWGWGYWTLSELLLTRGCVGGVLGDWGAFLGVSKDSSTWWGAEFPMGAWLPLAR